MMKNLILPISLLFLSLLSIGGYYFYTNKISGQRFTSLNLLKQAPSTTSNFHYSTNSSSPAFQIEPLQLSPEGNPYKFILAIGHTKKVGRASLEKTKYSYNFRITNSKNNLVLENNASLQSKNRLGGNTKIILATHNLGTLKVASKDYFNFDLNVDPSDTEVTSLQLHVRKNITEYNWKISCAISFVSFIFLIWTFTNWKQRKIY